ncbi:AAA family ATPase [Heliophilum fasciatum]|uniref:ATP-dependent metalloprotease FtsH n=1 Tax=Heliophilum fasciatum TaxID=35700 RepID=A0A4R2RI72_9FIRM|nr:AAA family ATPase [Heliophilum fasciatum]MCW2278517.1 vesicle-fusing ATPase [Heliophilum fasciatum]TCP63472.1 ATP-dependent metalloprotease FtsH [Heliophilum fasciatum]
MNRADRSHYGKEIAVGAVVALALFLAWKWLSLMPVLFLLSSGALIYFLVEKQGFGSSSPGERANDSNFTFDEIGGQEVAKQELKEALDFMVQSQAARELGIRALKGILLCGLPGTGKTLLAKAAATYTDSVFLSCAGSDFIEVYAGVGASRVRSLFKKARDQAKKENKTGAIVFIDEMDVLGAQRGGNRGHMEYEQTLNALLVEMDGLKDDHPVRLLVIGATNRPDLLDPALLRPGRFDRQIQVDLPDREGRKHILAIHTRNKPMADDVDLDVLAQETIGFSGAQLESVANEAAILTLRAQEQTINLERMKESIEKVLLGASRDRRALDEELWRVAVHETAHAMVSEWEQKGSVVRLTISPRGRALGYLRQVPTEERILDTRNDLLGGIRVALAGLIAEELILGQGSTGAQQDLRVASDLARRLLLSGLSHLGPIDTAELPETVRFQEIQKILAAETALIRERLAAVRAQLEKTARHLRERESLSGQDFRALMEQCA